MPKINVYLPDDLAEAVRAAELPVSAICQRALADAVDVDAKRNPSDGAVRRLVERAGLDGLTKRADEVVGHANARATDATSIDLLAGLAEEGRGLAMMVLRGAGVDVAGLVESLGSRRAEADSLDTCMARAVDASVELGHHYVGTEHQLLGLVDGAEGEPVADALRAAGVTAGSSRSTVRALLDVLTRQKEESALGALSGAVRTVLEEVRDKLARLEQ